MNNSKMNNLPKSLNNKGNKLINNGSNSIIKSTLNKISPDANSSMRVIIPAVILIISLSVIGVGIYYGYKYYTSSSKNTNGSGDRYQAVSGVVNATNQIDINRSNIPHSQYSNEYSISFWVKIDDYTYRYNEPKVIYRRGDADASNPEILLAPSDNNLVVRTKLQRNGNNSNTLNTPLNTPLKDNKSESFKDILFDNNDPRFSYIPDIQSISDNATGISNNFDNNIFSLLSSDNAIFTSNNKCPGFIETFETTTTPLTNSSSSSNNTSTTTSNPKPTNATTPMNTSNSTTSNNTNKVDIDACVVRNIPLQKWVSVIVSQYNQNIDIYIDGELASSCVSDGFPAVVDDNAVLCPNGGFEGKLANVILYNTAITTSRAKEIYYAGPNTATNILYSIPTWVYYTLILLVLIVIVYSVIA